MFESMEAVMKEVDRQGRIVLPARWRKKHLQGGKVLLRTRGDVLEVVPQKKVDLTAYFDAAEADLGPDLTDWRSVRRHLRRKR